MHLRTNPINFLTYNQAHLLLGHANSNKILSTTKCVDGLQINRNEEERLSCYTCTLIKSRNKTFNHILCKKKSRLRHSHRYQ